MRIKKKLFVITAICLSLAFSGCERESSETAADASTAEAMDTAASETENIAALNSDREIPKENPAKDEKEEEEQSAAQTPDAYPSMEEIMSLVNAGDSKLYWCAETPAYSGIMEIPPVDIPDTAAFTEQLSEMLGGTYRTVECSEHVIRLIPDGTEPDDESLLSALSRLTGTEYAGIEPEEIYAAQYVPEFNGYPVDDEGFSYGGARAGEGVMGSYIAVSEDGEITIFNPLIVKAAARTVDAAELVTPETVKTICRTYYENPSMLFVVVITDITLQYYYSESEESLLPAWRCEMTFYASENGHGDSILLDAQTGELLRK